MVYMMITLVKERPLKNFYNKNKTNYKKSKKQSKFINKKKLRKDKEEDKKELRIVNYF